MILFIQETTVGNKDDDPIFSSSNSCGSIPFPASREPSCHPDALAALLEPMAITRAQIESLALDQAALKAVAGLFAPATRSLLARDAGGGLLWGECQGSGAHPYRVSADLSDLAAKCNCPSRKPPRKLTLALIWHHADAAEPFAAAAVPDWVSDWLARRSKPVAAATRRRSGSAKSEAAGSDLAAAL